MLGEAGATVYCSGRSTREHPCVTGFYAGRPETIDETGDGDILDYRATLFYDLIKFSVTRFAFAMAEELHKDRVAAVAITPGFMRTEAMLDHFGATDPAILEKSGDLYSSWGLAHEYGFTDVDGSRPNLW
jgi:NAD(P)-dependent dehydrogenase (short-subunit alcohol dehydrogenase family)